MKTLQYQSLTVSHAFGLVVRYALIALLEKRTVAVFLKARLFDEAKNSE